MKANVGSVINVSIWRADGTVDHLGDIHNMIGTVIFSNGRLNPSGNVRFYTVSGGNNFTKGKYLPTGTWTLSVNRLQRVTGTYPITSVNPTQNDMVVFGSGERIYVSNAINVSAVNMRGASRVIPETSITYYATGQTGFGRIAASNANRAQQSAVSNTTTGYTSGVITCSATQTPIVFPLAPNSYMLECIVGDAPVSSYLGSQTASFFDITPSVQINTNDVVTINSYAYRVTFDDFRPRLITGSALSGTPFNYTYQRLHQVNIMELAQATRIYLIDNATPYTLTDMLSIGQANVTPSNITIKETLIGYLDNNSSPDGDNYAQDTSTCYGILTSNQANVKQIAWGDTSKLYGIVSFATAQNLSAGKVIATGQYLTMLADLA